MVGKPEHDDDDDSSDEILSVLLIYLHPVCGWKSYVLQKQKYL